VPPSSPHTHGHHWLSHSTCRNFPDCPFSVVVRELPGALRPNRKKKSCRDRFLYSFLCVCVRLWPEDILQHRRNGRNRRRKMWKKTVVCVWQWLTKVVTVEQFNWFIISRVDYSPIAFNPTSWIVAFL
jgi:hypothetical protein